MVEVNTSAVLARRRADEKRRRIERYADIEQERREANAQKRLRHLCKDDRDLVPHLDQVYQTWESSSVDGDSTHSSVAGTTFIIMSLTIVCGSPC